MRKVQFKKLRSFSINGLEAKQSRQLPNVSLMSAFCTIHFIYEKLLNYEVLLHINAQMQWILNLINCNIKKGSNVCCVLNKVYCGNCCSDKKFLWEQVWPNCVNFCGSNLNFRSSKPNIHGLAKQAFAKKKQFHIQYCQW